MKKNLNKAILYMDYLKEDFLKRVDIKSFNGGPNMLGCAGFSMFCHFTTDHVTATDNQAPKHP